MAPSIGAHAVFSKSPKRREDYKALCAVLDVLAKTLKPFLVTCWSSRFQCMKDLLPQLKAFLTFLWLDAVNVASSSPAASNVTRPAAPVTGKVTKPAATAYRFPDAGEPALHVQLLVQTNGVFRLMQAQQFKFSEIAGAVAVVQCSLLKMCSQGSTHFLH
ncbi:hypothetical protein VOLCADRAFT_95359 [Volvox carteri f. nagariensis]|uniref:Uncharacterized protein n=1 Tax=Volvox carteri f. nagariensis TaxID=3068 RepID=D8U787_VOLCA|nr:uncharacterized protein VOLCADRAFT_95359 [Volvox carteri f. nagariensis]EFJ44441.1 hypothetical protein VOLCADRAFT_95359 [Volvox carteri f. nagariensis]|eukprot:XP_002954548.1 hypothetical protein VOLCADRAFT_95359 [Volvox carteri f. nagariensis]